ncbi:MAG: VOC family protein [Solirubrobacterales bacterium]|nr:VOC family protein [Solirubrobacterales bacterium]
MATEPQASALATQIHPDTRIGSVHLTVRDLSRSRDFYERVLGLQVAERDSGALSFSAADGPALIELHGDTAALPLDPRATGLFHQALLMPTRRDLALALGRVAQARWPLSGASDHLVSEALYLSDPDGNGIEIYRDRPREQWPRRSGTIEMATLPLDLDDLIGELTGGEAIAEGAPAAATIGHVHLQVAELRDVEAFYSGVLGFDVIVRTYPGALFVSAGGYHHHIGLNTWRSAGSPPPLAGAVGLRLYEVLVPDADELDRVLARIAEAGIAAEAREDGAFVRDPSGNGVLLRTA